MISDLSSKHCESCEGIGVPLNAEQIQNLMPQLSDRWEVSTDNRIIKKS